MSTTSRNNARITRSQSRALSDDGEAAPSVSAPRSARPRSRRAASPAVANTPRATNRAYGSSGVPAVHPQNASVGMQQALDTIDEAVNTAGTSQTAPTQPLDVDRRHQERPATRGDAIPQSFWAPGHQENNFVPDRDVRGRRSAIFNYAIAFFCVLGLFGGFWLVSSGFWSPVKPGDVGSGRMSRIEQQIQDIWLRLEKNKTPQHNVNWFQRGFGSEIDIELSSPTSTFCDPEWKPWPFSKKKCLELPASPPHNSVLDAWEDPKMDRWCSPRSKGKLQLTVSLVRNILPTSLVVEYSAKDASPTGFMDVAPKEVELFVQITDDDLRAKVANALQERYPYLTEESYPQGRELNGASELDEDFVRVGRWIYNVYENLAAQSMQIPSILMEYGIDTTKVAVRVNSNWGNKEYTCINRLRMYGEDKSGIPDGIVGPLPAGYIGANREMLVVDKGNMDKGDEEAEDIWKGYGEQSL